MSSHGLSLDAALSKYLGDFGRHQRRLLWTVSLLWISNCLFILLAVSVTSPQGQPGAPFPRSCSRNHI